MVQVASEEESNCLKVHFVVLGEEILIRRERSWSTTFLSANRVPGEQLVYSVM